VVEKMDDPHLMDDFCASSCNSSLRLSHSQLKEKDELWKPLHMTLFEVSLPEASEDGQEETLKELISGMEQFYSAMPFHSGRQERSGVVRGGDRQG